MSSRASSAYRLLFISIGLLIAVFVLPCDSFSQKVRLRGHVDPGCETWGRNSARWKFADIGGDGNIAVQGSVSCSGVFIYDISDLDHPVLASRWDPDPLRGWYTEALVVGNRGYFGSGFKRGVQIMDLTDPYHPVLLGEVNKENANAFRKVHEMEIWGNYLVEVFNGAPNKIVKFINISDPANPVFVRDLVLQEASWVHATHIRGNRLFTSGMGSGTVRGRTEIYDLTNISTQAPVLLKVIEDHTSSNITNDMWMHSTWSSEDGNYLYSCREDVARPGTPIFGGDVRVYDVHDPANAVLVNRITSEQLGLNASSPHNPVVKGNRLYVSWYEAGLQVFDISNPAQPVRIGQYDTYPERYDITDPNRPAPLTGDLEPWDVACGNLARGSGMTGSTAATNGYDGDWAVYPFLGDDRILVGDMNTGLYIMDVTRIDSPLKNQVSDFDGDGKTDISTYSPALNMWNIEKSSNNEVTFTRFGLASDKIAAGDYDGDGKSDIALWRPSDGFWYVLGSTSGFQSFKFGTSGDVPVAADYDADGRTDFAVWRPSDGVWYTQRSTLGFRAVAWGVNGDKPLTGDYDGEGKADFTVWRPSDGNWYILPSSASNPIYVNFGLVNVDKPLSGDFDGDGKYDIAVYRPTTGFWYLLNSSNGSFTGLKFGLPGEDMAVPADYDGDGKTDIAVFRPDGRAWYRLNSSNGAFVVRNFGQPGDRPSPASVNPE
jgi:hypothetical protein